MDISRRDDESVPTVVDGKKTCVAFFNDYTNPI